MRLRSAFIFSLPFLASACATQKLDAAPDLSAYKTVELISNSGGQRSIIQAQYIEGAAYLELPSSAGAPNQRLYLQAEDCRAVADTACQRSYAITGDLNVMQNRLKCYIEVRNDSSTAYSGQALQGLCQDPHSRSYSITLSR